MIDVIFENSPSIVLSLVLFWLIKGLIADHQLSKRFTVFSDQYLERHPTAKTWDEINCVYCQSANEFKKEIANCVEGYSCSDCGKDLYKKPSDKAYQWTWFQKKTREE